MGSERISTHALTEGDSAFRGSRLSIAISTHALTEGDGRRIWKRVTVAAFQLTPSRRATTENATEWSHEQFQLTPSRRATHPPPVISHADCNFNSRPHGGRPITTLFFAKAGCISTHALTEGDMFHPPFLQLHGIISTHALTEGDLPQCFHLRKFRSIISTHALTEGDRHSSRCHTGGFHFNSRPHGGRLFLRCAYACLDVFQLTPSRRATSTRLFSGSTFQFQLTPSRRATFGSSFYVSHPKFQLTPSRRATIDFF